MRTSYGAVLRGAGGNPRAIERAGWSLLKAKRRAVRRWPAFLGVLAGLALIGITTSADANIGGRYTLLSIAGVILGGGEFVGGRVSPIGAVDRRAHHCRWPARSCPSCTSRPTGRSAPRARS